MRKTITDWYASGQIFDFAVSESIDRIGTTVDFHDRHDAHLSAPNKAGPAPESEK